MNYEFITNMYRELDPGTEYVLDEISGGELNKDVAFNVMLYRLSGSNVLAHSALGNLSAKNYDVQSVVESLRGFDGNVFGDAYRVAGYEGSKGDGNGTKVENVARLFGKIAEMMPEWWRRMKTSPNAKSLYEVFNSIEGFGTFLSNQSMVDLLMINESLDDDDKIWEFGTNDWCEAGPGAKRGIKALLVPGTKVANNQIVMAWLRDAHPNESELRELNFPYLLNRDDSTKHLSICNIQTILCEFHKYVRSRKYVKVRAYVNTPSLLTAYDICLSDEQIDDLRDTTPCTPPENAYARSDQNAPELIEYARESVKMAQEVREMYPTAPDQTPQPVGLVADVDLSASAPALLPYPEVQAQTHASQPISAPAAPQPVQLDQNLATILAALLPQQNQQQKPLVIPVDPHGLMGLPKAVMIIPIY